MKKNFFKFGLSCLCGVICLQNGANASFFDYIHPFVGASIGIGTAFYDSNVMQKYGVQYSSLSSDSVFSFIYGANVGVRFLDESYIYHPGIQVYYDRAKDDVMLDINRTSYYLTGNATHSFTGFELDNYIRILQDIDSEFKDEKEGYLVFGLDVGEIKSKYEIEKFSGSISEDGNFYGAKIEYLLEYQNGMGVTIGVKWLYTDVEALSSLFTSRFGLRYTF